MLSRLIANLGWWAKSRVANSSVWLKEPQQEKAQEDQP